MAARPISFALEEADIPLLDEISAEFRGGNRSEFLRVAMAELKERLRLKRLQEIRQGMEHQGSLESPSANSARRG
ncbi:MULTISPECIES: hypothetical protein [unclassified Microbacterium]|uniref:hypothetical protein n=1 Tax=unclassified Microbacterium TaxID=2609290 RepID=UPI00049331D3|nr:MULTISPECIES: hypothetical protein [unclassified Microbacterium]